MRGDLVVEEDSLGRVFGENLEFSDSQCFLCIDSF